MLSSEPTRLVQDMLVLGGALGGVEGSSHSDRLAASSSAAISSLRSLEINQL